MAQYSRRLACLNSEMSDLTDCMRQGTIIPAGKYRPVDRPEQN